MSAKRKQAAEQAPYGIESVADELSHHSPLPTAPDRRFTRLPIPNCGRQIRCGRSPGFGSANGLRGSRCETPPRPSSCLRESLEGRAEDRFRSRRMPVAQGGENRGGGRDDPCCKKKGPACKPGLLSLWIGGRLLFASGAFQLTVTVNICVEGAEPGAGVPTAVTVNV
jgi:hypothetical protein